jgi:hypothetical protein
VVIPLWYIGLFGVPHAVRCTIRGSLDEDSWPATTFRGGFIGVFLGCGVFFVLGASVVAGVLCSRRQRPGTTELLHITSWFSTSRCSYKKCHSMQCKIFLWSILNAPWYINNHRIHEDL